METKYFAYLYTYVFVQYKIMLYGLIKNITLTMYLTITCHPNIRTKNIHKTQTIKTIFTILFDQYFHSHVVIP